MSGPRPRQPVLADVDTLVALCGTLMEAGAEGVGGSSKVQTRCTRALDALAKVCLGKKDKDQVIAVALQLPPKGIRLVLAANKEIEPGIAGYLESIWAKLRVISTLQCDKTNVYLPAPEALQDGLLPQKPNPLHEAEIDRTIDELSGQVYSFCLEGLKTRFKQWYPAIDEFFGRYFAANPGSETGTDLSDLFGYLRMVEGILNPVPQRGTTAEESESRESNLPTKPLTIGCALGSATELASKYLKKDGRIFFDKEKALLNGTNRLYIHPTSNIWT